MSKDYRNTIYCDILDELIKKKQTLNENILSKHKKLKIIYNKLKETDGEFKPIFMEMYNYKCVYCGNSIKNISSILFEIDHFICESSFDSLEEAGKIENLVLSCYDCNRSKSDFLILDDYKEILHPDLHHIKDVFFRNDSYYIEICEKYKQDEFINKFYEKLKLSYQSRRLDFLLMSIDGLYEKIKDKPQAHKLSSVSNKLQNKRNLTSCKEFGNGVLLA